MKFVHRNLNDHLTEFEREDFSSFEDLPHGSRMFVSVYQHAEIKPKNFAEAIVLATQDKNGVAILKKPVCHHGSLLYAVNLDGSLTLIKQIFDSTD